VSRSSRTRSKARSTPRRAESTQGLWGGGRIRAELVAALRSLSSLPDVRLHVPLPAKRECVALVVALRRRVRDSDRAGHRVAADGLIAHPYKGRALNGMLVVEYVPPGHSVRDDGPQGAEQLPHWIPKMVLVVGVLEALGHETLCKVGREIHPQHAAMRHVVEAPFHDADLHHAVLNLPVFDADSEVAFEDVDVAVATALAHTRGYPRDPDWLGALELHEQGRVRPPRRA